MASAARLVDALTAAAPRYSPRDRAAKLRLLGALAAAPVRSARALLAFHETLCFLQAYPDDPEVLLRIERALALFPARVARLGAPARARLHDSGIAGTTLDYPFGLPMARWLAARAGGDVEVAWSRFRADDRLEDTLSLLVAKAEDDAFSEGGLGWRRWLAVARGDRAISDLGVLLELFDQARLPGETRDGLFEALELPILWRLRAPALSRTLAKLPCDRPFFHPRGPRRAGVAVAREVRRPLRGIRRADRRTAEGLIDAARLAMATRQRELYCFAYPNPDDVWLAEPGHGLRIALFGIHPELRQPFEGYYAFLALKNGVPVSYGGGWCLFEPLEFALNVFPSFRQGESTFVMSQILRVYRGLLGRRRITIDPGQLGQGNEEALRSGAFYFYQRAGFRPRAPGVLTLLEGESARIARDPRYRSPVSVLRQLSRDEVQLDLGGDAAPSAPRIRASQLAALVTRHIARWFAGNRAAATRGATAVVARALRAGSRRAWTPPERQAFQRWALVVAQIPDLPRWPAADRRRLLRLIRAQGGRTEVAYLRLLGGHRRLRASLAALAASLP